MDGRQECISSCASFISRRRRTTLLIASCGRYSLASEYYRRCSLMRWELVCDLMTASVWVGSRLSKDYGYGHPRRAGAPDLKEPLTSMGPEPAMDYVRRAVWGILNADDACTVSRSPQGFVQMIEAIVEVCRDFLQPCRQRKQRPCTCSCPYSGRLWCLLTGFLPSSGAVSIHILNIDIHTRHRVSTEFIGSHNNCVPMAFTAESPPAQG